MSEKLQWHNERRKVNDLIPFERNPRQMTDIQAKQLQKSIEKFDLVEVPAIDTDNKIVAGHMRMRIMQLLGRGDEEIDVRVPNRKLTDDEFLEYNLRSNKNTGEWDYDLLSAIDSSILLESGFDSSDLDKILKTEEDDFDVEQALPTEEPTSKLGEVYQLGRHRLMCGDSTKREDVEKLMDGKKADMVFTDPPYNVAVNDESEESLKARNRRSDGLKVANDKMSDSSFKEFLCKVFVNIYTALKSGGVCYICYADSEVVNFISAFKEAGFHFGQNVIWNKQQFVMTRKDYHYKHEPILYGWKEGEAHQWYSDRKQTSVWNFNRPFKSELHPTIKPIELVSYSIVNSSKGEDIILDLFGGSGSTLIAAEQTGRTCYMMELDPKYCDVIRKRYEQFTSTK